MSKPVIVGGVVLAVVAGYFLFLKKPAFVITSVTPAAPNPIQGATAAAAGVVSQVENQVQSTVATAQKTVSTVASDGNAAWNDVTSGNFGGAGQQVLNAGASVLSSFGINL